MADFNWPLFLVLAAVFLTAPLIVALHGLVGIIQGNLQRRRTLAALRNHYEALKAERRSQPAKGK